MNKFGNIIWGIVIIIVGLILGGNSLGITNINIFFDGWWTLFIIIPCFINLFKDSEKTGNLIGLLIGITLLLAAQNLIQFDIIWKLAFPSILVIIGLSMILKNTFNTKINEEIKNLNNTNKNQENEYYATFSGQDINFNNEEFKGANLNAIFGGINCNLNNALINKDQVINCSAIFGGIDIFVPNDINIKIKSTSIFGGVSNKNKNSRNNENSKTIYINATCLFGGVEIK